MITEPLVLILGAGASMPYKFPSGIGLTNSICKQLKQADYHRTGAFSCDVLQSGFEINHIHIFGDHLYNSQLYSIDAFLEHRPEFLNVGKACIARALIPHEEESRLNPPVEGHWYRQLFNILDNSVEGFGENKLSIITFNYDRSFEFFLFSALKGRNGISNEQTADLVRQIPIIHLHGDLGTLPFIGLEPSEIKNYHPETSATLVKKSASRIRIVHEDTRDDQQFLRAFDLMKKAKRICFFGFGFHPINMKRLFPDGTFFLQNKSVYATTYGMQPTEISKVRKYLPSNAYVENYDCLNALYNWDLIR